MKQIALLTIFAAIGVLGLTAPRCAQEKKPTITQQIDHKESVDVEHRCKTNDDCTVIKAGCCGCYQGGKQEALAKTYVEAHEKKLSKSCGEIFCAQVMSNDASCKQSAQCNNGKCILK